MKNTPIIGILALLVVLVISTASAAASEYYLTPQDSSVPEYCSTKEVGLWIDATEPIQSGVVWIDYTYCCANITAYTPNTTYFEKQMPVMVNGRLSLGYEHWMSGVPTNQPAGVYHIGNFTVHCCNETGNCKTDILFNDSECKLVQYVAGPPPAFKYLDFVITNGTFTCGEAGEPGIADHVVISEVQISGATATDEFVELYNPTNAQVSLEGWYLTKKTSGGTEGNLLAGFPDTSIPAHGFFLITHPSEYTGSVPRDAPYGSDSYYIAADNTVILYSDNKITVVDKVGFGAALDNETLSYPDNPGDDESLQRKINATIERDGYGPAWDTGNNSADFFIQTSNPRNSASDPVEPIPELSTLMLLTTGLVALVGYVIVKKGRKG